MTATAASAAPKVSVVMSVCNDAARVERAVLGILTQSFTDLELVAIDDGSSDGSSEILDRLAASDDRLRVIHQENTGLTRALIAGCREARGEFIARQDSDDWSHSLRIDEQVALLDVEPRVGFVSCSAEYVGPKEEHLLFIRRTVDPEAATHALLEKRQGPPAHGSVMFRRSLYEAVGGYRQEFYFAQDSDLWLRMAEHAWIGYVPEVRYIHRKDIHSTSGAQRPAQKRFGELGHLCRQARLQQQDEQVHLDEARALAREVMATRGIDARTHEAATAAAAYLLGSQLVRNHDGRARDYLWQVVRIRPWWWKAWVRLLQSGLSGHGRK